MSRNIADSSADNSSLVFLSTIVKLKPFKKSSSSYLTFLALDLKENLTFLLLLLVNELLKRPLLLVLHLHDLMWL